MSLKPVDTAEPAVAAGRAPRPVLVLSPLYPDDVRTAVGAVFQRLRVLLEAAQRAGGELHTAFFLPPDSGAPGCTPEHVAHELARHWGITCRVHLIPAAAPPATNVWSDLVAPLFSAARQPRYRRFVTTATLAALKEVCRSVAPELVIAHRLDALVSLAQVAHRDQPAVFDLDDVEHIAHFRKLCQTRWYPSIPVEFGYGLSLLLATARLSRRTTNTFVCSTVDKRRLDRLRIFGRVTVLPNGVPVPDRVSPPAASHRLLFVGALAFGPNAKAVRRLVDRIVPLIRRRLPDAVLTVVGKMTPQFERMGHMPGVAFAGFVDDLAQCYAETSVVVCPIDAGSGTRLKICEAAAHGRPVVSTTVGAEGLDFRDGEHLLIRNGDRAFADACCELLLDRERAASIGRAAREQALRLYERDAILSVASRLIREALDAGRARAQA